MLKKLADTFVKPVLAHYLKRERRWRYKGFSLRVFPGVFHPAFFFSSKYLFAFTDGLELRGKTCLEIGCGSGLVSLLMSRKGAVVTALDISQEAVRNTQLNFTINQAQLTPGYRVLLSDLFAELGAGTFDVIVVNPPYFFKEVTSESMYAWNCGAEGEYFSAFFSGLESVAHASTEVYMVLADNCDLERISGLALACGWRLTERSRRKIWWEENYIFAIEPAAH